MYYSSKIFALIAMIHIPWHDHTDKSEFATHCLSFMAIATYELKQMI